MGLVWYFVGFESPGNLKFARAFWHFVGLFLRCIAVVPVQCRSSSSVVASILVRMVALGGGDDLYWGCKKGNLLLQVTLHGLQSES